MRMVALVALVGGGVCVRAAATGDAPPNVVFLSVDTLRADRLGCYGYPLDTTPHLDDLAARSLVFEDCLTEIPLTGPSFGAMLSSRFPRETGTTRNGLPMPEDTPLATEAFRAAGYETFCVQSNWTLRASVARLDRGFDVYDDKLRSFRWLFLVSERYAAGVTDAALKLLKKRDATRPFFAWIHYSDPHAPYRFHRRFNPDGRKLRKLDEVAETRARYDSEVAYTDHHIGRLLKALPKENTFIVFLADHGESLHEHDYVGHGRRVYQTTMRVPLMISGPGVAPGRTDLPARGIDIGPTLLSVAGLEPFAGMLGIDLLDPDAAGDRIRVFETYGGAVPRIPGVRQLLTQLPPVRQGVVEGTWKLIVEGPEPELFDLEADPGEERNLAETDPGRVEALRERLDMWEELFPRRSRDEEQFEDLRRHDLEVLESQGYL